MDDLISRQAAIDALQGLVSRFEQILRDIRETKIDDSVCGMCEYDGAYMGQSGDWCNECPGFDKDDCFKLSEECKKRWLDSVELPSAQPEIIHCCECKYWKPGFITDDDDFVPPSCAVGWVSGVWRATDYCSNAERRQDD